MKIGIIGSGIAGLATAVCIEKFLPGTEYTILEQAQEVKEVGAGIGIGDNGVQILNKLGLLRSLHEKGAPITKTQIRDRHNALIKNLPIGKGGFCIHRAQLLELLFSRVNKENIRLNKKCVTISENGIVQAVCEDGSNYEFDLLIVADGIHSVVGKQVMPTKKMRHSGQTCYRGIATMPLEAYHSTYIEFIGNNLRFGLADLGSGKAYWYAAEEVGTHFKDNPTDRKAHLLKLFSSFPVFITELITHTSEILRNDMYDLEPSAHKWYTDKVCLIGDAAHATTPNLAQGGCQALEDAYTLIACLAKMNDARIAFAKYQALRQTKADFVVRQSWRYGQMMHTTSRFKEKLLLLMLKLTPDQYYASQLQTINDLNYLQMI